uniref:Uncharacterized protein n=1 Tax=Scleropages formosus TaxID=113540 RepID=A0A8C9WHI5_SCLFO
VKPVYITWVYTFIKHTGDRTSDNEHFHTRAFKRYTRQLKEPKTGQITASKVMSINFSCCMPVLKRSVSLCEKSAL